MRVALIYDALLPPKAYGGTERVVCWLAKGLDELGVEVVLVAKPGSDLPFVDVASPDFTKPIEAQVRADFYHHFNTPLSPPEAPHIVTIGGNGKQGETFLPNTVFISRNHAERHGADCYVYNGLDPAEYFYNDRKSNYLLFLAKAKWWVKNVKGAIRYARRSGRELRIVGGERRWLNPWRGVHWDGMLGGEKKAKRIADAKGLLFPVQWNEPFGLAVIEALVSGTPVLASPYGSLPELIAPHVGTICRSDKEFLAAIDGLDALKPSDCRDWVMEKFHYRRMAAAYLELYERVLDGEKINKAVPRASEPPTKYCRIPTS